MALRGILFTRTQLILKLAGKVHVSLLLWHLGSADVLGTSFVPRFNLALQCTFFLISLLHEGFFCPLHFMFRCMNLLPLHSFRYFNDFHKNFIITVTFPSEVGLDTLTAN